VEEILLPNGLTVEVWDKSIPIAADTTKVSLTIAVKVPLLPSYFAAQDQYEMVRKILGPEIVFEHNKERPFVKNKDREAVLQELLANFKENSLAYLGRSSFPCGFALSRYRDIQKNFYKYESTSENPQ
jgi:hypothetical protein